MYPSECFVSISRTAVRNSIYFVTIHITLRMFVSISRTVRNNSIYDIVSARFLHERNVTLLLFRISRE